MSDEQDATSQATAAAEHRAGLIAGFGAFTVWGLAPLYWKLLAHVDGLETVAHRTVWSAVFLVLVFAWRGQFPVLRGVLVQPALVLRLAASALLIGFNWYLYIFAVTHNRIVEASLGYFTNPLVSVLLGVVFLGEVLTPRRRVAIAIAALAVLLLTLRAGQVPWIAVGLASSFGVYGLLRKTIPVPSAAGLTIEALVLSPLCVIWLIWRGWTGVGAFSPSAPGDLVLLAGTGVLTAIPLWWFADAARKLPLSTVGMLQYLAPSLQFALATLLYHEPLDGVRLGAFVLIWTACILFSWPRRTQSPTPTPVPT